MQDTLEFGIDQVFVVSLQLRADDIQFVSIKYLLRQIRVRE